MVPAIFKTTLLAAVVFAFSAPAKAELIAGDVGRLSSATAVSNTNTIPVYQAGVLRKATPTLIPASIIGNASAAAGTPGNFAANRYLAIKDSSGTTYYLPLMAAPW